MRADRSPVPHPIGDSLVDILNDFETPSLVVLVDVVRANAVAMQRAMSHVGVSLRPHAKTHKCVEVARIQIEAGAHGLTVGTVGEAEFFAEAGIDDLFVAYPMFADTSRGKRLRALHERVRLAVGIDSTEGIEALARAVNGSGSALEVVIEVDCGGHRSGVLPSGVVPLAVAAARRGLGLRGVFTHGGHGYGQPSTRESAGRDELAALERARDALTAAGFAADVLSAGSTPTAMYSAQAPVTEHRPGTYIFNDGIQVALGSAELANVALFVATTVVSTAVPGQVIVDAGAKAVSRDSHSLLPGYGELLGLGCHLREMHDYHGIVATTSTSQTLRVGDRALIVPNHVCPTVNLYDSLLVVEHGRVVDTWEIAARRRNR